MNNFSRKTYCDNQEKIVKKENLYGKQRSEIKVTI